MKKILFSVLAVIIVAVIGFGFTTRSKSGQCTEVEMASVEKKKVVETVDATGKIQPKTQVEAGIQGERFIEITDGILVGEEVVIGSYRAISRDLTDGALVLIGGVEDRS